MDKNIKIKKSALEAFFEERRNVGESLRDIANNIGYSHSYFSYVRRNYIISIRALKSLCIFYGLDMDSMIDRDPPKEQDTGVQEEQNVGFSIGLKVFPEKVRVSVNWNGEEIYFGFSKVRGNKEVDLMQAISYATHMCFKKSEQKSMEEE